MGAMETQLVMSPTARRLVSSPPGMLDGCQLFCAQKINSPSHSDTNCPAVPTLSEYRSASLYLCQTEPNLDRSRFKMKPNGFIIVNKSKV